MSLSKGLTHLGAKTRIIRKIISTCVCQGKEVNHLKKEAKEFKKEDARALIPSLQRLI
jgi:hypothetical protein